jgi:hypothetical protein
MVLRPAAVSTVSNATGNAAFRSRTSGSEGVTSSGSSLRMLAAAATDQLWCELDSVGEVERPVDGRVRPQW